MDKIIWSYNNYYNDGLSLTKKDLDPLKRIYKTYSIKPESKKECVIKFLLDREKLSRYIIKELDVVLKVNGKLIVYGTKNNTHLSSIRSISQVKNEISLSLNNRYKLESIKEYSQQYKLTYVKYKKVNSEYDSIHKWSFGIITNGKNNQKVKNLIKSIELQAIPNYEIIICGPQIDCKSKNVKFIDDVIIENDIRPPISHKKNIIISKSNFENIVILHDRYFIPQSWYENMINYGNYFDLLSMPNLDKDNRRVNDWTFFPSLPFQNKLKFNPLKKYNYWSNYWFVQGGVIIGKKNILTENPISEKLYWGELEDVTFSQRLNLNGYFYYFDKKNYLITDSDRIRGVKDRSSIISILLYSKNYVLFMISAFKVFLNHKTNIRFDK
jgi:hypothetical protein